MVKEDLRALDEARSVCPSSPRGSLGVTPAGAAVPLARLEEARPRTASAEPCAWRAGATQTAAHGHAYAGAGAVVLPSGAHMPGCTLPPSAL